MEIQNDSSNNDFIELPVESVKVRMTYLKESWADEPAIRVQIRREDGHLHQGPDIPISRLGDVINAIIKLISGR